MIGQMKGLGDNNLHANYPDLEEDVEKLTKVLVSDYAPALTCELQRINKLRAEAHGPA